jgi:hypothetical protein
VTVTDNPGAIDPFETFAKATDNLVGWAEMVLQRQPAAAPMLAETMADAFAQVAEITRPLREFAEGKITWEEYRAQVDARDAADQEKSARHYSPMMVDPEDEDEELPLECADCGTSHEWYRSDHDSRWPPVYFTCEDMTGSPCDEEDDYDEDWLMRSPSRPMVDTPPDARL